MVPPRVELDLLRSFSRGGSQSRERASLERSARTWLGIFLAERLPHYLQPSFGAPGWTAVERAQEAGVVGRCEAGSGRGSTTQIMKKRLAPNGSCRSRNGHGTKALGGAKPFTLHPDGVGWLYVASGLKDGPLPAHYEPLESLIENPLYEQQSNPAVDRKKRKDNPYAALHDARFPFVLTTYRLTEHHTAGGMSRICAIYLSCNQNYLRKCRRN